MWSLVFLVVNNWCTRLIRAPVSEKSFIINNHLKYFEKDWNLLGQYILWLNEIKNNGIERLNTGSVNTHLTAVSGLDKHQQQELVACTLSQLPIWLFMETRNRMNTDQATGTTPTVNRTPTWCDLELFHNTPPQYSPVRPWQSPARKVTKQTYVKAWGGSEPTQLHLWNVDHVFRKPYWTYVNKWNVHARVNVHLRSFLSQSMSVNMVTKRTKLVVTQWFFSAVNTQFDCNI